MCASNNEKMLLQLRQQPSEVSVHSAAIIEKIIKKYLDPEAFCCIQGAVPETTALLRLRWDHIVYTGNGGVARLVMKAAANHLTPCTLELGGKVRTGGRRKMLL
jgi:aldehyde dehydrogenase (NAD+)